MRSPERLMEVFRDNGLRVTPQRRLLFDLLHGNTGHPTAERLYTEAAARLPGISRRTVYQTLTELVAMGEIGHLVVDAGAARFDPNVATHHHAVCDVCGTVVDVYVDDMEQIAVEGLDGFVPDRASIVFSGTCASCSGP